MLLAQKRSTKSLWSKFQSTHQLLILSSFAEVLCTKLKFDLHKQGSLEFCDFIGSSNLRFSSKSIHETPVSGKTCLAGFL